MSTLFPFAEYWTFYVSFTTAIIAILLLDLGVFHKGAKEISFRDAAKWSIIWVTLGLLFSVFLYYYSLHKFTYDPRLLQIEGFVPAQVAKQVTLEYLAGFVVEKSLAIDNIFVFAVVFSYFGIPQKYQYRVLFYGIIGALVFRIIFISLGSVLLTYKPIIIFFGAFLVVTGIKILIIADRPINLGDNFLIRYLKKVLPITEEIVDSKFFVRKSGKIFVTPLFLALVFIEFSDIIFAIDSVPAIFALTSEPLIVFTSNVFAILGLRAMYFLLANLIHKFRYLKYGLGIVLIFIGTKMMFLNEWFGGKFPIEWSLAIIIGIIGISVAASLYKGKEYRP
jgi:tellurite resistance protein TerC